MTRETKIGLLLGLGVILLIGIIISDQLSQVQKETPADFTGFAAETQRSIDASDAAPNYQPIPVPERVPTSQPTGPSKLDVPEPFFIPEPTSPTVTTPRQAQAESHAPLTAYNVSQTPPVETQTGPGHDGVPTLTLGEAQPASPITSLTRETASAALPEPARHEPAGINRPAQPAIPAGQVSVIRHTVLPNESLSRIARRYYGDDAYWRAIALANPGKVSPDGGIRAGVVLNIPKREDALRDIEIEGFATERVIPITPTRSTVTARTIKVESGDTLSGLASKYLGSAGRWRELLDANKDVLDAPEDLRAGMKLRLPGVGGQADAGATSSGQAVRSSATKTYTVRPGDTLTKIAERTLGDGDQWRRIYDANRDKLDSPDRLIVGQKLTIPG